MIEEVSKSRIDRLGDRLRKGNITESDLRLLDQYRLSFTEAYEFVVGAVRKELGLKPTGRLAKSTTSISEKLRETLQATLGFTREYCIRCCEQKLKKLKANVRRHVFSH